MVRLFRPSASLREIGPLVSIEVGPGAATVAAETEAGRTPHPPVRVLALVDTGSGRSILQHDLAEELRLVAVGAVEIDTPSSQDMPVQEYLARLWLDGSTSVELRVLEAPLRVPRIRALLGRDLLAFGRFTYDGPGSAFTLEVRPGAHPTSPEQGV
jgi:hypothetical protein